MKIYNVLGFATLALQLLLSALLAPPWLGPWWGMVVGFGYLLITWFIAGIYLSDIIHLGIADPIPIDDHARGDAEFFGQLEGEF